MANAYYRKSQKSDHKKDISFEKLKICEVHDIYERLFVISNNYKCLSNVSLQDNSKFNERNGREMFN